jgi:hypothetical protein
MRYAALVAAAVSTLAVGPALAQPAREARTVAPSRAPAAPPSATDDVQINSTIDRTALWVGDHVTYLVEVHCAPTVDIVTEDFNKEKIPLQGLEVASSSTERVQNEATGAVTYKFRYVLTTYDPLAPSLSVGAWKVRYGKRRAGQRIEDMAAATELTVPGGNLALRSTLPDDIQSTEPRDSRAPEPLPMFLSLARPVGLGLVLVSVAPAIVWTTALVARRRPKDRRRDRRSLRSRAKQTLAELQNVDVSSEAARREAYGRLNAVLRQRIADVTGIPAPALTPPEIVTRLQTAKPKWPAESFSTLLEECERAGYGPPGTLPSADSFRSSVLSAEQTLAMAR